MTSFVHLGPQASLELSSCCFKIFKVGTSSGKAIEGLGSLILGPLNCFSQTRENAISHTVKVSREKGGDAQFQCAECRVPLKSSLGAIIGGSIGGLLLLIALVVGIWLYIRRRSKDEKIHPEPPAGEAEPGQEPEPKLQEPEEVVEKQEKPVEKAVEPKKATNRRTKKFQRFNSTPLDSGRGKKLHKSDSPRKWTDSCFLKVGRDARRH
jgi:hypothetical protein